MKILASRFAQEIGGAEKSFFAHLRSFDQLGHETLAFTNLELPKSLKVEARSSLWFRHSGKVYKLLIILPQLVQAWWLVWRFKPDVINAHSRFDHILFTLLKPLHRRPVVWKDPVEIIQHIVPKRRASISQKLYLRSVSKADAIYELSEAQRRDLLEVLPDGIETDKIVTIPSGLDFSRYDLDAKPALERPGILIGYAARLHPAKGIRYLLEGFAIARRSVPDLRLAIIGDGDYQSRLKLMASRARISDCVDFIDFQEDVSPYLRSFDIYVCPSLYESWGLGVHEARLFGLPVIATDVGGIPEQIESGKNGILVEPKDSRAIAKAIVKLAKNPELAKELGRGAAKSARKQGDFTDTVEKKLLPLFKQVQT